jgi:hypothetical protein
MTNMQIITFVTPRIIVQPIVPESKMTTFLKKVKHSLGCFICLTYSSKQWIIRRRRCIRINSFFIRWWYPTIWRDVCKHGAGEIVMRQRGWRCLVTALETGVAKLTVRQLLSFVGQNSVDDTDFHTTPLPQPYSHIVHEGHRLSCRSELDPFSYAWFLWSEILLRESSQYDWSSVSTSIILRFVPVRELTPSKGLLQHLLESCQLSYCNAAD